MARVTGTISDGDAILFQDLPIDLQPSNPHGGPMGFRGEFVVPQGGPFIAAGRSCELKCSDGRRARFSSNLSVSAAINHRVSSS